MNDSLEVNMFERAHDVWTDERVKIKKPKEKAPLPIVAKAYPTEEEKRMAKEIRQREAAELKAKLKYDTAQDTEWFWNHLARELLNINITLDRIDADNYYAANTEGQVCRVSKDDDDTKHPSDAASETARKVVMFFAQQKLTRLNKGN